MPDDDDDGVSRVPEDLEQRIHEAARRGDIEFFPADEIEQYQGEAAELLVGVFGVKGYLISDGSELCDFATRGLPADIATDGSPAAMYAAWSAWLADLLLSRYSLRIQSPQTRLIDVFKAMRARASASD